MKLLGQKLMAVRHRPRTDGGSMPRLRPTDRRTPSPHRYPQPLHRPRHPHHADRRLTSGGEREPQTFRRFMQQRRSKAQLARKAGLPARTVENYFKDNKPSVPPLIAILQALSIDVGWLVGEMPSDNDWQTGIAADAFDHVIDSLLGDLSSELLNGPGTELVAYIRERRGHLANALRIAIVEHSHRYDAQNARWWEDRRRNGGARPR